MHTPNDELFYHDHGDGIIHCHEHKPDAKIEEHVHTEHISHSHTHTHAQSKAVSNRLARAIGHLESVKRMVDEERDCSEVLIQLAAVRSALSSTAKVIIKDHLDHCISETVDEEHSEEINELYKALDKFID